MSDEPDTLKLTEAARYLHVNPSTLYRLLKHKEIPGRKIGRWRLQRKALDAWMRERTVSARGES